MRERAPDRNTWEGEGLFQLMVLGGGGHTVASGGSVLLVSGGQGERGDRAARPNSS